uniref:Uncharacterized protein n=1 Tax=Timema douglasi TaxID=61478 RepID=A0A7R8Z2Y9_TIMDO|nr:unnamed protein product [Timema douglasi]
MFHRIIEVRNSLMSTIAINYSEVDIITNEDVAIIRQVCELLKVLKDCTEEMSGEKQVTASKITMLSQALKKWYNKFTNRADVRNYVKEMTIKLLEALNKRFKAIEENKVFAKATVLDPQFRCHGFSDPHNFERIAKHDYLPKMLCHKCVFKLEEYCEFRQLCLSTDKFFRSKLPWPDDSSQQGTLLQENELTITKSTSSFKGASCDGIVLNADYVNSRLGKTVATPLITDSSLLSQNNPVDSTIYLSNVSSTDKFILEVDDDEGRIEIDEETQKSAQAITSVKDSLPIYSTNKGSNQQVKRKQDKQGNVDNQKKKLVSAREQVMVAPTHPQWAAIFASSFRQVCRKNAHQMHLSQPGRNIEC